MKKLLMFLLVLVLAIGLIACTTETDTDGPEGPVGDSPATSDDEDEDEDLDADETAADGELVLSTDELAEYNGLDGSPAYIAVDGVIYDVTDSDYWSEGEHNGFEAGRDLTDELFDESPHGDGVLDRVPVVGRLED